jgi:hypothetical protein
MSSIQILINFKAYPKFGFNLNGFRFLKKTIKSLHVYLTKSAFQNSLKHYKRVNFSILMKWGIFELSGTSVQI